MRLPSINLEKAIKNFESAEDRNNESIHTQGKTYTGNVLLMLTY